MKTQASSLKGGEARQQCRDLKPLDIVQSFARLHPGRIGPLTLRRIAVEASTFRRIWTGLDNPQLQCHNNCVKLAYMADMGELTSAQIASVVDLHPLAPEMMEMMVRLGRKFIAARDGKLK